MRHFLTAGLIALSFTFASSVMAKDIATIDLFSGDYVGVAGVEVDQLSSRKVYQDVVADPSISDKYQKTKASIDKFTGGVISEADIDLAVIAIPADHKKSEFIAILEIKKDLNAILPTFEAEVAANAEKYERREVGKDVVYIERKSNAWLSILDSKRIVIGSEREVTAVLASKTAGKAAKPIKSNSALWKQYQAADKKADIWAAYVFSASELKSMKDGVVEGENGKAFKADQMTSASASISLVSGIVIKALAKMKSDAAAADGADALNFTLSSLLSDPALQDLGFGFLAKAYSISASKSDLKAQVSISNEQADFLKAFAQGMAAGMK